MAARSFLVASPEGDNVARALVDTLRAVPRPAGGLVFVSGQLARQANELATLLTKVWKGVPALVVPAAGILSDRGEVERTSAVGGLVWSGGRAEPVVLDTAQDPLSEGLARAWTGLSKGLRPHTLVLFARPEAAGFESFDGPLPFAPELCVFGGGTAGGPPLSVSASAVIEASRAVGLALGGLAAPLVEVSPALRLLTSFEPIEEVAGEMLLRLGGRPALEALSAAAATLRSGASAAPQPVVFAALAEAADLERDPPRFAVRNVRGVDPTRRGIVVGPELRVGMRCAFGVLDGPEARADLERAARRLVEASRGSAPNFGLFLTCAGRGQGLYGTPEVESRLLRQRLGDAPWLGMHSSFELAPWGPGRAKMQFFTAVMAMFRSPS
jgi:small ligand-binding sensory domain FIST